MTERVLGSPVPKLHTPSSKLNTIPHSDFRIPHYFVPIFLPFPAFY